MAMYDRLMQGKTRDEAEQLDMVVNHVENSRPDRYSGPDPEAAARTTGGYNDRMNELADSLRKRYKETDDR